MLKTYLLAVLSLGIAIALFGGILPALFSAKSTEAVLAGVLIVLLLPVFAVGGHKLFNGEKK